MGEPPEGSRCPAGAARVAQALASAETRRRAATSRLGPLGAVIADDTGVGTIVNDDGSAQLWIDDVQVNEGDTGTSTAMFTVNRTGNTEDTASVRWNTQNSSATAGSDYVGVATTTLTFAPGEASKPVLVTVNGDTIAEASEAFYVRLSSSAGAAISDDLGVATIANDDGSAYFHINDVSVDEGNAGTIAATFTITRSGATTGTSSVNWYTQNGTAAGGSDFASVPTTTVSFGPGETTKSISVAVTGDTAVEPHETFNVRLAAPVGATLSDDLGVGTIVNDD